MAAAAFLLRSLHFSPPKLRNTPHEKSHRSAYLLRKMMKGPRRRSQSVAAYNSDGNGDLEGDKKQSSFSPFGFVTDNPSSRSAIQLPESPAEDGNVGQMLYVIFPLVLYLHDQFQRSIFFLVIILLNKANPLTKFHAN